MPLDERHLPYADIAAVPATDEPAPSTVTLAMFAAQLRLLADLARSGRFLRLAVHAHGWARLLRVSPWALLARAIRPLAPDPPTWLSVPARLPTRSQSASAGLGLPAADLQVLTEIRAVGRTARADAQIAQSYGIDLHNPYCDGQVIDAALAVPAWKRGSARRYKPLLAAALRQTIPPALATRVTKGVFEADHHRGLRTHLNHILALADGELAARGLIDAATLRRAVSQAAAGLPAHFGFPETTLACEAWLRAVQLAQPIRWTTAHAEATV